MKHNRNIGGYIGVDFGKNKYEFFHKGYCLELQSARACLYTFLKSKNYKKIYVPEYYCDVIDNVFTQLDIDVEFYSITHDFNFNLNKKLLKDEVVILINYFGINSKNINCFLENNNPENVIIDNAQAFFSKVKKCAANIYSPRKFFGIPDGGYLFCDLDINVPLEKYKPKYIEHLLLEFSGQQTVGYNSFLQSEQQLIEQFSPVQMSDLSKALMKVNDFNSIAKNRIDNFIILDDAFKNININQFILDEDDIPLCYPLRLNQNVSSICNDLINRNIFLPRYWPSITNNEFYTNTLFLPVDQRLDKDKIYFLINEVKGYLK
ncbi:hypothetical protein [Aliivibrio fischeri]|uniref:hypothetical protein n=1 Tax=Aliivibrio fischeri TaxID=668 RepID=UPI0007C575DF|nr:hypothetical protein [Aliivibrio fischeri]